MKLIRTHGREVKADEQTPLTAKALREYMCLGRGVLDRYVRLGYAFEYGSLTTPAHLRAWMKKNAGKLAPGVRGLPFQTGEDVRRLGRELAGLR